MITMVCAVVFYRANSQDHSSLMAEYQEKGGHFRFGHDWDSYRVHGSVERARQQVQSFCQEIVVAMRHVSSDEMHPAVCHDAFKGPLASGHSVGPIYTVPTT